MRQKNGRTATGGDGNTRTAATSNGNPEAVDTRELLKVLTAVKRGDFSVRMSDSGGVSGRIAETLNDIIELNERMSKEFERVSRAVGKEGKTAQRASIGAVLGSWNTSVDSLNSLVGDLVQPSTEMARVIGAVAKGDLTQTVPLEVDGRPPKGASNRP